MQSFGGMYCALGRWMIHSLNKPLAYFLISQVTIDTADMLSLCLGKAKAQEMVTAIKEANCPPNIKDPIR